MSIVCWQVWAPLVIVAAIGYLLVRRKVLLGSDLRLSTSKTVTFAWTLFAVWVFAALATIAVSRDQPLQLKTVSDPYLLLLGGPFAALVAAKGILTSKLNNGTAQKSAGDGVLRVGDLVNDDAGRTDLVDLQFVLFNLVPLVYAVVVFARHADRGLPDLPMSLVGLTSVSALTYIGNKAVQQNASMISGLSPASARVGDRVVIQGQNLVPPTTTGTPATAPQVQVNGVRAVVESARADAVEFTVPAGLLPGQVATVTLTTGAATAGTGSASTQLTVTADAVVLSSVNPTEAVEGAALTLTGRGFTDPLGPPPPVTGEPETAVSAPAPVTVLIGGISAPVHHVEDRTLVVTVPPGVVRTPADGPAHTTAQVRRGALTSNQLPVAVRAAG